MAGSAGAIRAGKAAVEVSANDAGLAAGLARAQARLSAFGASVQAMGVRFLAIGGAALGGLGVALGAFSRTGSELNDMSARTGVSVEALSELGFAARLGGSDLAGVEDVIRRMQRSLAGADEESKGATEALQALGLTIGDLKGLAPDEQLMRIAARLDGVTDATQRTSIAMDLFGKAGTKSLAWIGGLEQARKRAAELGLTMSTQMASQADAFGDALDTLKMVGGRAFAGIAAALAPMVTEFVGAVARIVSGVNEWIDANPGLVQAIAAVAVGVTGLGAAMFAGGIAISAFSSALSVPLALLGPLGAGFRLLGPAVALVLSPLTAVSTAFGLLNRAVGPLGKLYVIGKFVELKLAASLLLPPLSLVTGAFGALTSAGAALGSAVASLLSPLATLGARLVVLSADAAAGGLLALSRALGSLFATNAAAGLGLVRTLIAGLQVPTILAVVSLRTLRAAFVSLWTSLAAGTILTVVGSGFRILASLIPTVAEAVTGLTARIITLGTAAFGSAALRAGFSALLSPIGAVTAAVGGLGRAMASLWTGGAIGRGYTLLRGGLLALLSPMGLIAKGAGAMGGILATSLSAGVLVGGAVLLGSQLSSLSERFGGFGQIATAIFGNIGQAFRNLASVATTAFGGIVDAVMAGDLGLAWDVAVAGLRAGWAETMAYLTERWIAFSSSLEDTLGFSGNDLWAGLRVGFIETITFLRSAWAIFQRGMISSLETIGDWTTRLTGWWLNAAPDTVRVSQQQNRNEANQQRADQNFEGQMARIEQDRVRARGQVERDRTEGNARDASGATQQDANDRAAQARNELEELARQAGEMRSRRERDRDERNRGMGEDIAAGRGAGAVGTFSGSAIGGLAGSAGPLGRIADLALRQLEEDKEHNRKLQQLLDRAGLTLDAIREGGLAAI